MLVEWDPFTTPILTEVGGTLAFRDIMDDVTIREQIDEVTGLAQRVIIEDQEGKLQPRVSVKALEERRARTTRSGETRGRYMLPVGAHLLVDDGADVSRRATSSPRSRARRPRPRTSPAVCRGWPSCSRRASRASTAVITEIDGVVRVRPDREGHAEDRSSAPTTARPRST